MRDRLAEAILDAQEEEITGASYKVAGKSPKSPLRSGADSQSKNARISRKRPSVSEHTQEKAHDALQIVGSPKNDDGSPALIARVCVNMVWHKILREIVVQVLAHVVFEI